MSYRSYHDDAGTFFNVIVILISVAIGLVQSHGISDKARAERTLTRAGYSDIKVGGASWFACGSDWYNTTYTAKSPSGTSVSGTVCTGLFFKNSTIRFDD